MNILKNTSTDKKDVLKAVATKLFLKDFVGEKVNLTNIIIYEKVNETTGEVTENGVIQTEKGWLFTQSPSVLETLFLLEDAYIQEEVNSGVPIQILSGKSKANREFYYIDIL